jgi:hypothetical protein
MIKNQTAVFTAKTQTSISTGHRSVEGGGTG